VEGVATSSETHFEKASDAGHMLPPHSFSPSHTLFVSHSLIFASRRLIASELLSNRRKTSRKHHNTKNVSCLHNYSIIPGSVLRSSC